MANNEDGQVGQALVDFALSGAFPEEPLSSGKVMPQELGPALGALAQAKSKLEVGDSIISSVPLCRCPFVQC